MLMRTVVPQHQLWRGSLPVQEFHLLRCHLGRREEPAAHARRSGLSAGPSSPNGSVRACPCVSASASAQTPALLSRAHPSRQPEGMRSVEHLSRNTEKGLPQPSPPRPEQGLVSLIGHGTKRTRCAGACLTPLWAAWRLSASAPYSPSLLRGGELPNWQVGGRWLFFFPPDLDQSTAEVSKCQPHPHRASLPIAASEKATYPRRQTRSRAAAVDQGLRSL